MPLFITHGTYTPSAIEGMLADPTDRATALKTMVEQAGGQIVELYMTTGEHDFVLVSESLDEEIAVAWSMVTVASGTVTNLRTARAWKSSEFKTVVQKAAGLADAYTPPGGHIA